jgi:hypothetical protein
LRNEIKKEKKLYSTLEVALEFFRVPRIILTLGGLGYFEYPTITPRTTIQFTTVHSPLRRTVIDNLRKHHVIVINRCCMCKKMEESVDHLLLHCDVDFALWYSLFSRFGLSWVMPWRVIDLLACWWSSGRLRSATVWKMAPTCLFWCFWREEITRTLRTWRRLLINFYLPITLCIFGLRLMCSPYLLAFLISLLVSLVRRFLLYTHSVLRGASHF